MTLGADLDRFSSFSRNQFKIKFDAVVREVWISKKNHGNGYHFLESQTSEEGNSFGFMLHFLAFSFIYISSACAPVPRVGWVSILRRSPKEIFKRCDATTWNISRDRTNEALIVSQKLVTRVSSSIQPNDFPLSLVAIIVIVLVLNNADNKGVSMICLYFFPFTFPFLFALRWRVVPW